MRRASQKRGGRTSALAARIEAVLRFNTRVG
jgi:hypothetical protein